MCVIERTPVIETRRLTLRAPAIDDAARMALLMNAFDIARMTSRIPHPYGLDDATAYIQARQASDPAAGAEFLIELEDQGVVGGIGFNRPPGHAAEVGYWVGKPWWGRGVASEALTAALDWAARIWKRRMITAGHFADNPASGRVLCKAGFLYTGQIEPRPSLARGEPAATRMMIWLP